MAADAGKPTSPFRAFLLKASSQWIFLILIAFVVVFSFTAPGFFSIFGFANVAVYSSEPLLLAVGETFVIISGGIDLSVGALLGFTGVIAALLMRTLWALTQNVLLSILISAVAGLAVGTALGVINGVIIAKLKVPPFVVTLGMQGIARGSTYVLTSGHSIIGLPEVLGKVGNYYIWGVLPVSVLATAVLVVAAHMVLSKTRLGRYTYSIGGSRQASVRAGVPVDKCTIRIYALSGFMAACAGILILARFSTGSPLAGQNSELNSIAAAVIGGVSLLGGIGNVLGTVIGALIIGVLLVGLVIMNVQPYWQMVSVGGILILAVFVDNIRYRRTTSE
jgi:ribose transport system permease protein